MKILLVFLIVFLLYRHQKYKDSMRLLDRFVSLLLSFREDRDYFYSNRKTILEDFEKKITKENAMLVGYGITTMTKKGIEHVDVDDWLWSQFPNKMKSHSYIDSCVKTEIQTVLRSVANDHYEKIIDLFSNNAEMSYKKYKQLSYRERIKFIKGFLNMNAFSKQDIINFCHNSLNYGITIKITDLEKLEIALYSEIVYTVDELFKTFDRIEELANKTKK